MVINHDGDDDDKDEDLDDEDVDEEKISSDKTLTKHQTSEPCAVLEPEPIPSISCLSSDPKSSQARIKQH
jgi:hypothetical protein